MVLNPDHLTGANLPHVLGDNPILDDLRFEVLRRINTTFAASDPLDCQVSWDGPRVIVHLAGPQIARTRQQALSVLVLDAVRNVGHTYGQVNVTYDNGLSQRT